MKVLADFNGLFSTEDGLILCLSHSDTATDEGGKMVALSSGMVITAFEPDTGDNGEPDELLANGIVIESPAWLKCSGSRWSLALDEKGWYHASDIRSED